MKKKNVISLALAAAMTVSCFTAVHAAEHEAGAHDFGDPFAPYLDSKLVLKDQVEEATTISHTSKNVSGSPAVTADIIESSAQFYTRDNGDGSLADGSLTDREYGNVKNIMFAYMYEPAADGKYPAILFLHGGGGTADTLRERAKDFAAKGYVTMAIDIPALTGTVGTVTVGGESVARSSGAYIGNDNYRFNITEAEGGAKNSNLVDAEVGVIQAFNYLAENAKVDKSNMGLMGSSWGGYSTTFVSGILGDKVKAAYSQYGSGFYGPTPDGAQYDSFWTDNGYYPTDAYAIEEWYRYLDPSSHLDNIKANYYMDAAAKDTFFRPRSVMANLDKASGTAESVNHVWSYNQSHESISGSDTVYVFMDYYLKGEGTKISETEIVKTELLPDGSNEVHIKVTADAEPASVQLIYSKNDTGYTSRSWKPMKAEKQGDEYVATLDAATVKAGVEYYALTRDSYKAAYSSSMIKTGFTQKVDVASTPKFAIDGAAGNVLKKGTLTASVPVVNNDYASSSDVKVILSVYKNGVLKTTDMSEESTLEAGESRDIEVSAEIEDEDVSAYTAKLMVWDSAEGMKPYSRTYNLSDIDAAPTMPENFRAVSSTIDGIELAWDASEDNIAVEGYYVYRRTDGAYEKIATLTGNSLTYTDTMIEVNETYYYAVSAFDGSGSESERAEVSADSIEGAKVVFDAFDSGSGTTVTGEKMTAILNTADEVAIEAHKPLQDEREMNCLALHESGGKYIQLKVNDDYINASLDNKVAIIVTFDDVNFDNIRMQYNAADGNSFKPAVIYKKLNEQRWMTKTYVIEDAAFANLAGAGSDLRLNFDRGYENYIRMIQIVNLSEDFKPISSGVDSIGLAWKSVKDAQSYELYRNGELIAEPGEGVRSYTDQGLTIDTEYTYTLKAVRELDTVEIKTITASTLKKIVAEADFTNEEYLNMTATTTGYDRETVEGTEALVTESNTNSLKLAVDNSVVTGTAHRLVTFKYNDCGNKLSMRVSMVNAAIDRAHYFYTNGSGKWETATVLIPDAAFGNNGSDIQIYATQNAKYAIADVKLSDCPSYETGATYVNGIVSGVTVDENGMLNSSLAAFRAANDKSGAEAAEIDGTSAVKLTSTDVNDNGVKRAAFNLTPDYRMLGQNYSNAVMPGEDGFDERPAAVRPVTVKVTYYKNNSAGMLYIKGAKLDEGTNTITNPDNDAALALTGEGEWATAKINLDDYYVRGTSMSSYSPIQIIASGVPENEDIIIGKIEVTLRDYSTKLGEYEVAKAGEAEGLTVTTDDGAGADLIGGRAALYVDRPNVNFNVAVDTSAAAGTNDRYLVITYNDCGTANMPVRVSMINTSIDGAHYFYTRGTDRWETTTILIPDAKFGGNPNDIQIRLIRDGGELAISKVELYDGGARPDGGKNVTGITSGITNVGGNFNSTLATWLVDEYTTLEPVTVDGEQAVKIVSSRDTSRAELRIVPDYRYLGLTSKSGSLPDGTVTPVKVRVTYYKGSGIMYVKGSKLSGNALAWPDNDGVITLSKGSGWVTEEINIDDYFTNGGSDAFNSYIQLVTNNAADGTIIKSIEIIAK